VLKQRTSTLAYLGGITLAAGGTVFYWLRAWPAALTPVTLLVPLFVLLAVIAQHFPLPIGPQRKVDASISVYFASLLLFGAAVAVLVVGLAQLLGQLTLAMRRNPSNGRRRRGLPEVVFNTSQLVLATGLGSIVYFAFLPQQAPAVLGRIENLWALPVAATTIYLANSFAVAGIVGIQLQRNPLHVWRSGRLTHTLEFAGLLLCGLVTAIATIQVGWAPVAMLILTAILFFSLQRTLQLLAREQELRLEAQSSAESVRALQHAIEGEHSTLAAVMAQMTDGLLLIDEAGEVRYCNDQAVSLLQLSRDTIVGRRDEAVIREIGPWLAEPDAARSVWKRVTKFPKDQPTGEIALLGPPKRDILLSAFSIAEHREAHLGLLLRDITIPKQVALLEERERIAMDLHDGVIQQLYGVGLVLSAHARTLPERAAGDDILGRAVGQIDDVIEQIRSAIFDLRPRKLSDNVLAVQLTALAAELRINELLRLTLEVDSGAARLLPPEDVSSLLQVAREATTNIIRHARTSQARICLTQTGNQVVLTVSDNGVGFVPSGVDAGQGEGLRNMAERARLLGGHLTVTSLPGRGTEIHLEIPVSEETS
jgi:signal transduction histidine kinase